MRAFKNEKGIAPIALAIIVGAVLAGAGSTVVIADTAKPGDLLYGLDRAVESIQLAMATTPEDKAKTQLGFAEERLSEIEELQKVGVELAAEKLAAATALYKQHLENALAKADEARANGKSIEEVQEIITANTLRSQATLSDVYNQVPDEAKPAIQKAQEVSKRGFEEASSALSSEQLSEIVEKVKEKVPDIESKIPTEWGDRLQMPSVPVNPPGGTR